MKYKEDSKMYARKISAKGNKNKRKQRSGHYTC